MTVPPRRRIPALCMAGAVVIVAACDGDRATPADGPDVVVPGCHRMSDTPADIGLDGLGVIGEWRIAGSRSVGCSEPYLGSRLECELGPGAVFRAERGADRIVYRNSSETVSRVLIDGNGIHCAAVPPSPR